MFEKQFKKMREESGGFQSEDPIVSLFYIMMRDGIVSPGELERLVCELENEHEDDRSISIYTNGWLAKYAQYLSSRIGELNEESSSS